MAESNENTLLLMNGTVVNVFTEELEKTNVLIKGGKIIGVGAYTKDDAGECVDVSGKYICPGFINGIGLKHGAIASTVSHDSHNLIVIGTNDEDMAFAANKLRECGGGSIYVKDLNVVECLPLPVAGLMSELCAEEVALQTEKLHEAVHKDGVSAEIEPFMNMAFVSLAVIPAFRMTTRGLVDVCT